MVAKRTLASQLNKIGFRSRIFGYREVAELQKILMPGESVLQCAYGYYDGGSGLFAVTDHRVLLIDKKPLFLNIEELSHESIRSVQTEVGFLYATISVVTVNKKLVFRSVSDARLKHALSLIDVLKSENSTPLTMAKQYRALMSRPYIDPRWVQKKRNALLARSRPTKFTGMVREA